MYSAPRTNCTVCRSGLRYEPTSPLFFGPPLFFDCRHPTQQIYAEYFCGFNRLDAEISFGEALAKATAETQRASSKMDKQKNTSAELSKPMTIDTAGDQFLLAEHVQGYSRRKAEETNVISSALWQRARVTMMAVNSFRRVSCYIKFLPLPCVTAGAGYLPDHHVAVVHVCGRSRPSLLPWYKTEQDKIFFES